jgi:NAD-dependent deacetylase
MTERSVFKINPDDRVAVLTGAGISAESGIKTFRDSNGLWENHSVEEVATPEGFARNPELVWEFYRQRYQQMLTVKPNSGHYALKELEEYLGDNFLLITQNIDGLHSLAGSKNLLEMHGTIRQAFCAKCRTIYPTDEVIGEKGIPHCEKCSALLRPDVVWFGEMPYHMEEIINFLQNLDYFITVGTSGVVYPAAQFLITAKYSGSTTIGINLETPDNYRFIDEFHQGLSGKILPDLVRLWTER